MEFERKDIKRKIDESNQNEKVNKVNFEIIKSLKTTWSLMTFEEQRSIIESLIDKVVVDDNRVSIYYNIY